MRAIIIVLVLVGISFAAVMVYGLEHGSPAGGRPARDGSPPTKPDGSLDQDALQSWSPPALGATLGALLAPFAPRLTLATGPIAVGPAQPRSLTAPPSGSTMRIARFAWSAGAPMRVRYSCAAAKNRSCPEVICVCQPGLSLDEGAAGVCGAAWVAHRRSGSRLICGGGDDIGTLVIYPEGGAVDLMALGGASTVRQK